MKKKLNERGLPSVGGISPGDTSNNLGQARRPWNMTGAAGGHSQSADSGFSSRLGRVNKGRETDKEHAYRIRFPDNEEESEESEEDKYDMNIRSKISLDLRGRKPMPEVRTLMSVLNCNVDDLIRENEELQSVIDEDIVDEDDEIEESSVAGSIGGYVGPMAPPANPKQFYKRMLRSYPGSHYINDLPKSKV
jgi:hypothetical protein